MKREIMFFSEHQTGINVIFYFYLWSECFIKLTTHGYTFPLRLYERNPFYLVILWKWFVSLTAFLTKDSQPMKNETSIF